MGVDLATLADRPVVRDLVALGQALLDAGDRTAWLAVLRSPACGSAAGRPAAPVRSGRARCRWWNCWSNPRSLPDLSADAQARLQRVGPVAPRGMARARQCGHRRPYRRLLAPAGRCCRVPRLRPSWPPRGSTCWHCAACRNAKGSCGRRAWPNSPRRLLDRGEHAGREPGRSTDHPSRQGAGMGRGVRAGPGPAGPATTRRRCCARWNCRRPDGTAICCWPCAAWAGRTPPIRWPGTSASCRQSACRMSAVACCTWRRRAPRLRLYLSGYAHPAQGRSAAAARRLAAAALLWPAVAGHFTPGRRPWHVRNRPQHRSHCPCCGAGCRPTFELPPAAPPPPGRVAGPRAGRTGCSWTWNSAGSGPLARAAGTVLHAELERLAMLGESGHCGSAGRVRTSAPRVCGSRALRPAQAADTARAKSCSA